jgi:hypothetical protein
VAIIAFGLIVALGLLGAGVYAVFNSTNGAGTAALLIVGSLVLFVVVYHDRIRSLEFGGAKIQFALKIKDGLKAAFELRLTGNYEEAEDKLEFAFAQFVAQESDKRWKEFRTATDYQETVLENLEEIIRDNYKGRVMKTASALSFLPLIDLVVDVDGPTVQEALTSRGLTLCPVLTERLQDKLRCGVIVRPGPALNSEELVKKLLQEAENGALQIDCFLLVQNCKGSKSAREFRDLAIQMDMHATSLHWEPDSGRKKLAEALQTAILTVCDRDRCPLSSQATSLTGPDPMPLSLS